ISEKFMLYAQRPGNHLGRHVVRNKRLRCSASIRLRYGWNVHLQQAAKLQESLAGGGIGGIGGIESGAPLGRAGKRAGEPWILFGLQLRWQAVNRKVVWHHIVGKTSAAANRPFAV